MRGSRLCTKGKVNVRGPNLGHWTLSSLRLCRSRKQTHRPGNEFFTGGTHMICFDGGDPCQDFSTRQEATTLSIHTSRRLRRVPLNSVQLRLPAFRSAGLRSSQTSSLAGPLRNRLQISSWLARRSSACTRHCQHAATFEAANPECAPTCTSAF